MSGVYGMGDSGMDFRNTAAYQRRLQKLATLRPEQRAIVNTAFADREAAGEETRRELEAMRMGAARDARGADLALAERRMGAAQELHNDAMDFTQGQAGDEQAIAALGAGVQGGLGMMEGKMAKERARRLEMLAGRYGAFAGGL